MTERLLQYLWQFQYLHTNQLETIAGEALQIIFAGEYNTNQGPDFKQARIKINQTLWAGEIELHVKASDWHRHHHASDKNFSKIILHVVWENDVPIIDEQGNNLSTLELQNRVPNLLLNRYEKWMSQPSTIPCGNEISNVPSLIWQNWKERLLVERLEQKSKPIFEQLQKTNNNWEEVFWRMLCRYFGTPINTECFEQLATSISVNILAKHKNQLHQLEALLLGQAGLLHEVFTDHYPLLLQREYQFLQKKWQLQPIPKSPFFLRMRPVNFPTVRLAQLAMLVHQSAHLFSKTKEADNIKTLQDLFDVTANDFWNEHYTLHETSIFKPKRLGSQMTNTLLINTIIPMLFAFGKSMDDEALCDKAVNWLEQLPAEKNNVTNVFTDLQMDNKSAFDSQVLLQLHKQYCKEKRCLECAVGNAILRKDGKQ